MFFWVDGCVCCRWMTIRWWFLSSRSWGCGLVLRCCRWLEIWSRGRRRCCPTRFIRRWCGRSGGSALGRRSFLRWCWRGFRLWSRGSIWRIRRNEGRRGECSVERFRSLLFFWGVWAIRVETLGIVWFLGWLLLLILLWRGFQVIWVLVVGLVPVLPWLCGRVDWDLLLWTFRVNVLGVSCGWWWVCTCHGWRRFNRHWWTGWWLFCLGGCSLLFSFRSIFFLFVRI